MSLYFSLSLCPSLSCNSSVHSHKVHANLWQAWHFHCLPFYPHRHPTAVIKDITFTWTHFLSCCSAAIKPVSKAPPACSLFAAFFTLQERLSSMQELFVFVLFVFLLVFYEWFQWHPQHGHMEGQHQPHLAKYPSCIWPYVYIPRLSSTKWIQNTLLFFDQLTGIKTEKEEKSLHHTFVCCVLKRGRIFGESRVSILQATKWLCNYEEGKYFQYLGIISNNPH